MSNNDPHISKASHISKVHPEFSDFPPPIYSVSYPMNGLIGASNGLFRVSPEVLEGIASTLPSIYHIGLLVLPCF